MGPDGVFPAEMRERGSALAALDDNTVERLVGGRVEPDDAPPGYAGVAKVLQGASGPAGPDERAGQEGALAMFRAHGPSSRGGRPVLPAAARRGPHGRARGRVAGRGRVVALALAGVVAAGGLWMAGDAPSPPGLPSRAGAPQTGGAGSGVPGLVTQARPMTSPVTAAGASSRASAQPPAADPSTRNGGGVSSGPASHHGAKQHRPGKPPKPKPEKPKPKDKPKHQR